MAEVSKAWGEAYAEWLAARAEMAKLGVDIYHPRAPTEEDEDRLVDEVDARITAAEHRLIQARVTLGWQLLEKFEVLQAMILQSERDGAPADDRHLLMLASFHADLMKKKFVGCSPSDGGDDAQR